MKSLVNQDIRFVLSNSVVPVCVNVDRNIDIYYYRTTETTLNYQWCSSIPLSEMSIAVIGLKASLG